MFGEGTGRPINGVRTSMQNGPMLGMVLTWDRIIVSALELSLFAYREAAREVLGENYPITTSEIELVTSMPVFESAGMLTDDSGLVDRIVLQYHGAYIRLGPQLLKPVPGAVAALGSLRAQGLRLGVVTVKPEVRVRFDIECCGLAGLIDTYVSCVEGENVAHPSPVWRCLANLELEASDVMFVAGRLEEIVAARAAGIESIVVPADLRQPVSGDDQIRIVESLSELPGLASETPRGPPLSEQR